MVSASSKRSKEYPFLDKNNGLMRADVFFIVPTLFTDKRNKNWNSDVYDNDFANTMMESTIKYQSTAWLDSGNLYSPNYRQAHYKFLMSLDGKMEGREHLN